MIVPSLCGTTLTPSSTPAVSLAAGLAGARVPKSVLGPVSFSVTEAGTCWMLTLSSTARALTTWVPTPLVWKR